MPVIFLADTKPFLELSANNTAQDSVIQLLIDGAHEFVERTCGIKLDSDDREELLDGGQPFLQPTMRPITELTRVTDMLGGEVGVSAALQGRLVFKADDDGNPILPVAGWEVENYPGGSQKSNWWDEGRARYKVEYVGGYDSDTVPAGLKVLLYQIVRRNYYNREGVASESAAGASKTWITDAEFKKRLAPYDQTQKVSVG
jgi:hypothetical protein